MSFDKLKTNLKQQINELDKINLKEVGVSDLHTKWIIQLNILKKIDHFINLERYIHQIEKFIKEQAQNKIDGLQIIFYFNFTFDDQINEYEYRFMLDRFQKHLPVQNDDTQAVAKIIKYKNNVKYNGEFFEISIHDVSDWEYLENSEIYKNLKDFWKQNCNLKPIRLIKVSSLDNKDNFIIPNDFKILTDLNQLNHVSDENFLKPFNFIQGYVLFPENMLCRNDSYRFTFFLSQENNSIKIVFYITDNFKNPNIIDKNLQKIQKEIQSEQEIQINLSRCELKFNKNHQLSYLQFNIKNDLEEEPIYNILITKPDYLLRKDDFQGKKRIEFHIHTKMSNLDGIISAQEYLKKAQEWGHKAIAFTDHNGIYAYPEIFQYSKNHTIKPIYGIELDFVEEKSIFITNQHKHPQLQDFLLEEGEYVVFDIETTGFSPFRDKIIEIAGIKIKNKKIVDHFHCLVNPEILITKNIEKLTNITNDQLKQAANISDILPQFLKFIANHCLVAHNASFDMGFLIENIKKLNIDLPIFPVIDTLTLAQNYFGHIVKYFSLKRLAPKFKVKLDTHHRAQNDAKATAEIFIQMLTFLAEDEHKVFYFSDLKLPIDSKYERSYDINVLVKNQIGYRNLCEILSNSLTDNFYKHPRTLKSVLEKKRKGLLIGSGCYNSNIFKIALEGDIINLRQAIAFYDYIEVQPPQAYKHLIADLGDCGQKIIETTILTIIQESKKQNKIIIASGDVHYLHPYEKIYREIYINAKLVGGGLHKLSKYDYSNLPDNAFLTTQEMLDSFSFLENELAYEIVITNTHKLNQKIKKINIFPNKLFFLSDNTFANSDKLQIKSIREELKTLIITKKNLLYGKTSHPLIQERIDKELKSILGDLNAVANNINFSAVIYYLSYLLVKKSLEDGYLVGSRGSIGSSLVAKILDITEVNPLPPHYICLNCHYTIIKMTRTEISKYQLSVVNDQKYYDNLNQVYSGYDLPDAKCPKCQNLFKKDGHDIPFETFLGFEGNKIPDIDLNFAGNYQSNAHNYIKELLGKDNVFKAGTIQTVAEKNAYGYVKGYLEDRKQFLTDSEISRRSKKIEGVKRSTGQHPGGIIIVPQENSVFDITPIQYPANDTKSTWKTTHFDYHSFENNLLKLDILGHDDPIMIKFFMDYVNENPDEFAFKRSQDIPVDDPKIYELFFIKDSKKGYSTLGIPEFGTFFVRSMLEQISNKKTKLTFADLVKISGLSHGTNVWRKNAEDLILQQNLDFNEIIGCRDDIMSQLIDKKIPPLIAFEIMEFIRKGGPSNDLKIWKKYKDIMQQNNINQWYIDSAEKIKYLFPKAHAVAYVIMAMRIAWFKVFHPLLFYSGFFSKRVNHFDYDAMIGGETSILNKIKDLKKNTHNTSKNENLISILKVALEFIQRKEGFKFLPIDLNKSAQNDFILIKNEGLLMPLVSLDGLGPIVASRIIEQRKNKFVTKNDFLKRTKVNKTIFAKMENSGLLDFLATE